MGSEPHISLHHNTPQGYVYGPPSHGAQSQSYNLPQGQYQNYNPSQVPYQYYNPPQAPYQNYNPPQAPYQNYNPPQTQSYKDTPPRYEPPAGPPPIPANKPTYHSTAIPSASAPTPYWKASFDSSIPVSQNFKHQLGAHGWGNNELQNYVADPTNSFHLDNRLILRATASNGGTYTSARLTSHATLGRQRGSLQVTAQPPAAAGIWPAFWLLPSEPFQWPYEGEVDILENWNADGMNHSCLHWGHFNGEDHDKHRVVDTHMPDFSARPHTYEFAWEQPEHGDGGRMVWYIDGRAVMKASIPKGTRRMSDWQIIINVAMGGHVCQGKRPADGHYDFVIYDLRLMEEPTGGWERFGGDWNAAPEGHAS